MSGICSAHKHHDHDCPQCNALPLLKPCPFCGGAGVIEDVGCYRCHIYCDTCPAQIGEVWSNTESKEYLINKWNTRLIEVLG